MKMQVRIAKTKRIAREDVAYKQYFPPRLKSILAMFEAVISDIHNLLPIYRRRDSARDIERIKTRLSNEGLGFLSTTLPHLMSDLFLKSEGGAPLYAGFKTRHGYPVFLGRLFQEVYEDGTYSAEAFGHIYQICVLFKKLKGPYSSSVLRNDSRKFLDSDIALGNINFNDEPLRPIIEKARRLITAVFKGCEGDLEGLRPRPGPGSTNTFVDKHMRFRPHTVYTRLDEEFPYLDYFYSHHWDPVEDAWRYMNLPEKDEAVSRYKTVPKYLGKPRGICIEENEMQFFQQAVKRFLYDWLESHRMTKGYINFTSQQINRDMALQASIDGDMVTLDMSEASNMVARECVYRLYWDTPLSSLLDALSTRFILMPDKTTHPVHMFAPMGSGICFPIMATVHWALIKAIIQLSSIPDSFNVSREVYVYGDDILYPVCAHQAVVDYLPLFGMKVNTDKSFAHGLFRESCGIHAYNGVDVTPVYVNHITSDSQACTDTSVLISLIAKEQHFDKRCYEHTSQCIQKLVRKHYWSLPTVGETSPVLGFKRNGRTTDESIDQIYSMARKVRYDEDLHTVDLNIQCVRARTGPWAELAQGDGYLRKLLTNANDSCYMPGRLEDLMVVREWVSLEAV